MKSNIVLIILAILNMMVVALAGFHISRRDQHSQQENKNLSYDINNNTTIDTSIDNGRAGEVVQSNKNLSQEKQKQEEIRQESIIVPMEMLTINIRGGDSRRMLILQFDLLIKGNRGDILNDINKNRVKLRDAAVISLSDVEYENTATAQGKEQIKKILISSLNKHLSNGLITEIYFKQFETN